METFTLPRPLALLLNTRPAEMARVPLRAELLPLSQSVPVPCSANPCVPFRGTLTLQALLPAERKGQQVMVGDERELSRVRVLVPSMVHDWAVPV